MKHQSTIRILVKGLAMGSFAFFLSTKLIYAQEPDPALLECIRRTSRTEGIHPDQALQRCQGPAPSASSLDDTFQGLRDTITQMQESRGSNFDIDDTYEDKCPGITGYVVEVVDPKGLLEYCDLYGSRYLSILYAELGTLTRQYEAELSAENRTLIAREISEVAFKLSIDTIVDFFSYEYRYRHPDILNSDFSDSPGFQEFSEYAALRRQYHAAISAVDRAPIRLKFEEAASKVPPLYVLEYLKVFLNYL